MANNLKCTREEWSVDHHFACHSQIRSGHRIIAQTECVRHNTTTIEEIRANAEMMAASKDLYEALNECVQALDVVNAEIPGMDRFIAAVRKGHAAMAKARGEK